MAKEKDESRGMNTSRMMEASLEINKVLDKFYDFENAEPSDYSEILMLLSKMIHIMATQSAFAFGADEIPINVATDITYKIIQTTGAAVKDISKEHLKKCVQEILLKKSLGGAFGGFDMGSQDLN